MQEKWLTTPLKLAKMKIQESGYMLLIIEGSLRDVMLCLLNSGKFILSLLNSGKFILSFRGIIKLM